jgi:Kelch motif
MTYEIFSSLKSSIIRWPRHLLMAGGLCLLVACGGGGGGGATSSATFTAPSAPSPTLTRTDGGANINPGFQATFVPLFSYGTGRLTASDGSISNRAVNSGEAVTVTPNATTTYTLVVNYQDPSTVRTSILQTTPVMLTVTVNTLPNIVPDVTLGIDTQAVLTNGGVVLTPQFTVPSGLTLDLSTTGILTNNLESSFIQVSASGISIPRTGLQADTTYTLRVTYIDTRDAANPRYTKTNSKVVTVTTGAGKIGIAAEMNIARSDFSATPLHNGQVLVCGGVSSTGTVLNSCELYDPFFGTWTNARPMATVRRGHAATLLRSGKVLVSGGYDGTVAITALKTTEIYDPGSRSWSAGTPLIEARTGHTSILLNNDKVLIVGGAVSSGRSTVVELFDPSTLTGVITATGSLNVARQEHTATLLPNGHVLIAGRNDSDGAFYNSNGNLIDSKSTEIYDPVAATWSLGPTMAIGRRAHAASLINSTISTSATAVNDVVSKFQILITGGAGNIAGDKAEVLTRETKITTAAVGSTAAVTATTWTVGTAITMPAARSYHTSTLLDSGDVLLVGGKSIALADLDTIDLFDVDNTTAAGGAFSPSAQKKLNYARSMHRSVRLTSSAVLIVGNYFTNAGTADKKAELWSPP